MSAIATCQKVAARESDIRPGAHLFSLSYWGKGMYPQAVEEYKLYGQLDGNSKDAEFASALEQGFHSGGWKAALTKGIEVRKRSGRRVIGRPMTSPASTPGWEKKTKPFAGSTPRTKSGTSIWRASEPTSASIRCVPTRGLPNSFVKLGCRESDGSCTFSQNPRLLDTEEAASQNSAERR